MIGEKNKLNGLQTMRSQTRWEDSLGFDGRNSQDLTPGQQRETETQLSSQDMALSLPFEAHCGV